jgi:pimeloyl-ACP methyl ester carboxylesterase
MLRNPVGGRGLLGIALAAAAVAAAPAHAGVRSLPVSFTVENVNRSDLPCDADGATYRLAGRIVGPEELLAPGGGRAATLYVHEYSFGKWFWDFAEVPGYDYATRQAAAGHVSVLIDRLGYDDSDHPPGTAVCLGSHADMIRQVVGQLRAGSYAAEGGAPLAFERVVLAAHSVGAVASELAVHSFPDLEVAGLAVFAWADQGFSQRVGQQSAEQAQVCATGGEEAEPGGPGSYAYYGQTPEDFHGNVFASADPAVVEAATRLRNRDPCGDAASLTQATVVNSSQLSQITVPVLLLFGGADAVFEPGAGRDQASRFGSEDVTYLEYAGAGHALLLEPPAPQIRVDVARWLAERGLVSAGARAGDGCPAARIEVAGTGDGDDAIAASERDERIAGGTGDDRLTALAGDDCLRGGPGGDTLVAGEGADDADGEAGADVVSGGAGDDRLSGGTGADRLRGGAGRDRVAGGAGRDSIHVRDGARDRVSCGSGRDRVVADRRDRLSGCERVRR